MNKLLYLLLLVVATAACTPTTPAPATPTPAPLPPTLEPTAEPTSAPTLEPTIVPSPTAEPTATAEPEPEANNLTAPHIRHDGLALTLDPRIAPELHLLQYSTDPYELSLGTAPERFCSHGQTLCIYISDAQDFADMAMGGEWVIDTVRQAASGQPIDEFPTVGAAVLLQTHMELLATPHLAGVRALIVTGQDMHWAHAGVVTYQFQGLTPDGQYYVHIRALVDAPLLMNSGKPFENTRETALLPDPMPTEAQFNEDYFAFIEGASAYHRQLEQALGELEGDVFTPSLAVLDALVASLVLELPTAESLTAPRVSTGGMPFNLPAQ